MNDELLTMIEREVKSWPGVTTAFTGRGGLQFVYGRVELGHLHGSSFADLPFPKKVRDELIAQGRASVHPPLPESGWVRRRLDDPEDAEAVIELLRMNYERAKARAERHGLNLARRENASVTGAPARTFRQRTIDQASYFLRPPIVNDTTTDHERDVEAIKRIIADVETGFNTKDPDLSVEHFTQNASVVNVAGMQVSGRDALFDANRRGLAGRLRAQYARYKVSDVVFLRPDVAIAHKHAWATTADGEPIDVAHSMIALYVLVKEDERWWVAARQNTMVAS
jgi:uncharacterized protein (TIGR02246 family)